jgi:biopolymer transport protein ExbB
MDIALALNDLSFLLAQQTPEEAAQINSVFDFVIKGGPLMIPIALCSLVAFTIIMERLITLRRSHIIPPVLIQKVREKLKEGGGHPRGALDYCKSNPSAAAAVLCAAIKRLGESEELLAKHIQEAGERESLKLRKRLRVLSVIGSIAPLLGLLGTITGMITAFQTVAASGEALGRTELLAEGIYEAMITTAAGLIVAIPVLVCYHWFVAKVDGLVMQIDALAMEFIDEFAPPRLRHVEIKPALHDATSNGQSEPAITAVTAT